MGCDNWRVRKGIIQEIFFCFDRREKEHQEERTRREREQFETKFKVSFLFLSAQRKREEGERHSVCVCNRVDRYDLKGIPVDTLNIKTMRLLIMIKTTKCIRSYEL